MYVSNPKKFLNPHRVLWCTCSRIKPIYLAWMSALQIPEIAKHTYLFIYWELLLHYWSCWPQITVGVRLVKSVCDFSYNKTCRKLSDWTFCNIFVNLTRSNSFKLNEVRFGLDTRKQFFSVRVCGRTGIGSSEKLQTPHPWECPRHNWMGLWTIGSRGRRSCPQ